MGAFSIPSFGSGDGSVFLPDGSILVGGASNSTNDPFAGLGSLIPSPIFLPSGTPSGANPTPTSGGSDAQSWLKTLFPWAQLGTQAFLADQAVNSPRPATVQFLPNGQIAVSGGGAASPLTSSLSSISPIVWLVIAVIIIVMVIHK